jgi:hypothetical protein
MMSCKNDRKVALARPKFALNRKAQPCHTASLVILSEAKYLAAPRDRPLAECTLSEANRLRVTKAPCHAELYPERSEWSSEAPRPASTKTPHCVQSDTLYLFNLSRTPHHH